MNTPLLSLCIPTYNRVDVLKKSIDSIIVQDEFENGFVEIIISDNVSTDNTEEVCREYAKNYNNIFYFKNDANVMDMNFPLSLSRAHGKLRKLCNDTTIYFDGSLGYMCEIIKKYEDAKPFIFWSVGNSRSNTEIKIDDLRSFVLDSSFWLTNINFFSIWDSDCVNIENDNGGCALSLWQVNKALELVSRDNRALICNKVLFERMPQKSKYLGPKTKTIFYDNYFSLLEPYFKNGLLDEHDRDVLEKDLLFNFFFSYAYHQELHTDAYVFEKGYILKDILKETYQDKSYWKEYKRLFNISILKYKIKKFLRMN